MINSIIPLEIDFSGLSFLGFLILLIVPILLFLALLLFVFGKKDKAKRVLIGAGICALAGLGICGVGSFL